MPGHHFAVNPEDRRAYLVAALLVAIIVTVTFLSVTF
jgi:hypothetical protein